MDGWMRLLDQVGSHVIARHLQLVWPLKYDEYSGHELLQLVPMRGGVESSRHKKTIRRRDKVVFSP